jgi:hypothetical protein
MTITRRRLREVDTELFHAYLRASVAPEKTTIVSKEAFEDIRLFRAIGPTQLSNLRKDRGIFRSAGGAEQASGDADAD